MVRFTHKALAELGSQVVELRKAPSWQLWGAGTREGAVLRAVEWMGPEAAPEVVGRAVSSLTPTEKERLLLGCASAPTWLAERLTRALFPDATGGMTARNG